MKMIKYCIAAQIGECLKLPTCHLSEIARTFYFINKTATWKVRVRLSLQNQDVNEAKKIYLIVQDF